MKPSLILSLILATAAHAQIFTPKDINLSVSFSNVNPAVTSAMSAPGGPGLKRVLVTATTFPAPAEGARQALKDYVATGPLAAPAIFTVDDTVGGLTYAAQVLAELHSGQQYYFPRATAGLNTAGANPAWSIADTASLVNFQFVDSVGAPVAVNGGIILANDPDIADTAPSNLYLADGATGAAFLARGGSHTTFAVYVDLGGTDPTATKYRKKYTVADFATTPLPADAVQTVTIVIDAAANTSGSLSGRFDVTQSSVSANEAPSTDDGFFEIYAPTPPNDSHPDYPILRTTFNAGDGYGNWDRDTSFLGTNFSSEASGAFTSANLLPSPAPAEGSYNVYGETFLQRSISGDPAGMHRLQFLRTPWLGSGINPAPTIPAGNFDSADTFVIKPGYLTGSVTLAGPDVIAGYPALLAHVVRSTDDDTNGDGLPDSPVAEWFNGSVIRANGLDTLATGATLTASGGQSFVPLPGSFNASSGDFTGHYHFALGGLNGESAFWQANTTSLRFYNPGTSANTYFFTDFSLTDRTSEVTLRREMAPDATQTSDISHEFGEVSLRIRATSGTIYQPQIRNVTDDPTKPLNPIAVSDFLADGWPNTQTDAATTATVRCLIPAGTWMITPRINPGDQAPGASIDLVPISIEVPARGRIGFETEFLMNTSIPACLSGSAATISGTITSTGSLVTEIRYSIDGGEPIVISNPNSLTPSFSIDLSTLEDGPHRIVITATGANGEEAFVDSTFHRDAVGLTIQKAVILTWGCGVLQTSTDMENWTDVTGATSPFAVPTNEPKRFWQVRHE